MSLFIVLIFEGLFSSKFLSKLQSKTKKKEIFAHLHRER